MKIVIDVPDETYNGIMGVPMEQISLLELIEAVQAGTRLSKIVKDIETDLDNLQPYTVYMGASQADKVCVEFKKVRRIIDKYLSVEIEVDKENNNADSN